MSCFGMTYSPGAEAVILLSDGLSMENGAVAGTDSRKVWRVNDHLAYVWMGAGGPNFQKAMHLEIIRKGISNVQGLSDYLGDRVENALTHKVVQETTPVFALAVGFDEDGIQCRRFWSPDGPDPHVDVLAPGMSYGLSVAGDCPYAKYVHENIKTQPVLLDACTAAFTRMVSEQAAAGHPVGGKLFTEIITDSQ